MNLISLFWTLFLSLCWTLWIWWSWWRDLPSSLSLRYILSNSFLSRSHVTHPMPLSDLSIPFVLLPSHFIKLTPVLFSCHSSHVTHLISQSHVTHLLSRSHVSHHMSLISCLITLSHISCLITSSLISCLIITSVIQSYCHIFSLVATFNFCPWPLPTNHRIILPVTSAHPLCNNLCQPCRVLLPRRIGIFSRCL